VRVGPLSTPAEDFAHFQKRIPGFYFFLGIVPADQNAATAPRNHSPYFFADEGALPVGVRAMANLAVSWLQTGGR
jgi:amidohydrolase